jgi:hypothetical protein
MQKEWKLKTYWTEQSAERCNQRRWWDPNFQVCRIYCPHQGPAPASCAHSTQRQTDISQCYTMNWNEWMYCCWYSCIITVIYWNTCKNKPSLYINLCQLLKQKWTAANIILLTVCLEDTKQHSTTQYTSISQYQVTI